MLSLLQNLPVQVYVNGVPQWADPPYNTIPKITTVSVLNAQTSLALLTKYNADNLANGLPAGVGPPAGTYGFILGGGGSFDITAQNMDLGTTAGIQSRGGGALQRGRPVSAGEVVHQRGGYFGELVREPGNVFDLDRVGERRGTLILTWAARWMRVRRNST
ncbi:MAG: hypothetical protein WDM80_02120 [Limisphaerales bacterium]